jgi:hypothetical protein
MVTPISKTLPGREFFAWTPQGHLLMSDGSTLFSRAVDEGHEWTPVKVDGNFPTGEVTRISINMIGNKLALVVNE